MATLPRFAKSGSDWITNDLLAYNIIVSSQIPETFYDEALPAVASLTGVDRYLLYGSPHTQGLSDETLRLLEYLDLALVQASSDIILLPVIQGDTTTVDPEPQVIASAIATFQYNNRIRARLGEEQLDSMTIPCITMIGTLPIFYLVPVTRELSEAVFTEQHPPSTTKVDKCVVVSFFGRLREGMENVGFRQAALQHYTTFRSLASIHWSAFTIRDR